MHSKSRKIVVSIVEPIGGHGGMEFYDFGLCEALASKGCEVTLYTSNATTLDECVTLKTSLKKFYVNVFGSAPKIIRGLMYAAGAARTLIASLGKSADIAHFHIFEFSLFELFNICIFKLCGIPTVVTVHDVESLDMPGGKLMRIRYLSFKCVVDKFLVHSKFSERSLNDAISGISSKVRLVPHSDCDFVFKCRCSESEARSQIYIDAPQDAQIILFFGQIKEVKGLDLLIEAFSNIVCEYPNARLLVAGKPWRTDYNKYLSLIDKLGIKQYVINHIKYIDNKDVPVYFRAASMVVLPYRKVYNSGVLLRSLDYGAAVIASDIEPFREVITDGVNGMLFSSGQASSLEESMRKLLGDKVQLESIRDNARDTIESKHSWEKVGETMEMVYREVISK